MDTRQALLASLPPGLGHLRAGQRVRGLSVLGGLLFLLYVVLDPADYAQPPPPAVLALLGAGVFAGFWVWAARDLARAGEPPSGPRGRSPPASSGPRGRGRGNR